MQFVDFSSAHGMLKSTVDSYPDRTAYSWFVEPGVTESVNWREFYDQVIEVAKSLIALGIKKDDKVNIISYSCYRWALSDLGITTAGGCTVGIYQSNLPKDCQYIIDHCDAVAIFAEDQVQLDKLFEIKSEIPDVKKVILLNGDHDDDWVLSYEDFIKLGKSLPDEEVESRVADTKSTDTAAIVYTSGTTGVPKGSVLTHDNITFTAQSVKLSGEFQDGDKTFLFLPLAHIFAKSVMYSSIIAAVPLTFARKIETVVEDIAVAKPNWFASVPRIYEKIYSKILGGAESKGGLALKIFRWAVNVGEKVSDIKLSKKPVPLPLKIKYAVATKLVFSKVQNALGGNVRWCISGAAPLNPSIAKFFHAAGILILEGIGMTENTSFTNINRYDNYRFGWVGQTGPGIEQKIADDGEVMFRGRNVMKEYYKNPEATERTFAEDGWLYTGDIGEIDDEGFLKITDRKKHIIITAGGKNIAPSVIEGVMTTSKYIGQVCIIGDRRKYLSALVTLEKENIEDYAKKNNIQYNDYDELNVNPEIVDLITKEVQSRNKEFASFETIKKISIVPEWTIENSCMTPSMKIKKNVIIEEYDEKIGEMYPE
ncbi:MAG: long-chain fatty acid--CoA ligase [Desulfobacterales bacterium]|nr:long-chain fatty acid--CoA ligase [Desulfobacterales bacterium]MCP4159769.1 long-chain fatty acid--CoA ligase [Deltaproteobacteria bacterium]